MSLGGRGRGHWRLVSAGLGQHHMTVERALHLDRVLIAHHIELVHATFLLGLLLVRRMTLLTIFGSHYSRRSKACRGLNLAMQRATWQVLLRTDTVRPASIKLRRDR